MDAAKDAATRFAEFLGPNDTVSVVGFDSEILTVYGPARGGTSAAADAIGTLYARGRTNLSGGWLKGRDHVVSGMVDGTNRVVLFTDGCANQGITDPDQLYGMARGEGSRSRRTLARRRS